MSHADAENRIVVANALVRYAEPVRVALDELTRKSRSGGRFEAGYALPAPNADLTSFFAASDIAIADLGEYAGHRLRLLDLMCNERTRTTKTFASRLIVARAVEHIRRTGERTVIVPVAVYHGARRDEVKTLAGSLVDRFAADLYKSFGVRLWYTLDLENYRVADSLRSFVEHDYLPHFALIRSQGGGGIVVSRHECLQRYPVPRKMLEPAGCALPAASEDLREWSLAMALTGVLNGIDRKLQEFRGGRDVGYGKRSTMAFAGRLRLVAEHEPPRRRRTVFTGHAGAAVGERDVGRRSRRAEYRLRRSATRDRQDPSASGAAPGDVRSGHDHPRTRPGGPSGFAAR